MANASDIEYVTIQTPFGASDQYRSYEILEGGKGITHKMTIPVANGGKPFTRHDMNGFGYYATLGTYLVQQGYPMGIWRAETAAAIGGYPKGAILAYIDDKGYVVEYESKVDNNTESFPSLDAGRLEENDYWRPLTYTTSYLGVINTNNLIGSKSEKFGSRALLSGVEMQMELTENAYVRVSRDILNYSGVAQVFDAQAQYSCQIYQQDENNKLLLLDTIATMAGESAAAVLPMAKGTTVVVKVPPAPLEYSDMQIAIDAYGVMGAVA